MLSHLDACAADRVRAGELRDVRRRPDEHHRAHLGWPEGRRRARRSAAGCASSRSSWAARRSGPGGPGSRTFPPSSASARPPPSSDPAAPRRSHGAAPHRSAARRARGTVPGRRRSTATPTPRLPTSCASASTASRPNRSCSRSTSRASSIHSGSACSSESLEPSPVLAAMGADADHVAAHQRRLVDHRRRRRPLPRRVPRRRRAPPRPPDLTAPIGAQNSARRADSARRFARRVVGRPDPARVCVLQRRRPTPEPEGRDADRLERPVRPSRRRAEPRDHAHRDHVLGRRRPTGSPPFDRPLPAPLDDGRTGRVPAGCVFWNHATESTFSTVKADHGNCSVGSLTHGFVTLDEVAGNGDVAALLETGWVTMDVVPQIPVVTDAAGRRHLRPARRVADRPRRRAAAGQRQAADGAVGRDPRTAGRGQAPVPHRRDRQGAGRDRGQRRLRAVAGAHRRCRRRR